MSHRRPSDETDLFREVFRRLEALEQRATCRAGRWVISENGDGDLVATSPSGRTVVLSDPPQQVTVVQETVSEEEST